MSILPIGHPAVASGRPEGPAELRPGHDRDQHGDCYRDRTVASPVQGEVHAVVDMNHVGCAVGAVDERVHRS